MNLLRSIAIFCLFLLLISNPQNIFPVGRAEERSYVGPNEGPGGLPLIRERVTLDYFMANHKTRPFKAEELTIAELQKKTNVYFNIISIDSGYWDKYKVMLASNDLPDLIFTTAAGRKVS